MDTVYQDLLSVLDSINEGLVHLIGLQQEKKEIVMGDDLAALNEIINREQAEALSFRGLEHRRTDLLQKIGLQSIGLQSLAEHFPEEMRTQAQQAVEKVQKNYKEYRAASSSAREMLERALGEIEHVLAAMGESVTLGPGYTEEKAAPPSNMKTDFRA